jgi:hypothetical protein
VDKWDYLELNSFCTTKEMVHKLKRLITMWEKIFASCIADWELITRIYMQCQKTKLPQNQRTNKEINRTKQNLCKEGQVAKKHIKEMQIKTTLIFTSLLL